MEKEIFKNIRVSEKTYKFLAKRKLEKGYTTLNESIESIIF